MSAFPPEQDGGYVKLMLPGPDKKPLVRTYTIRSQTDAAIDIDFALHGDHGSGGPAVSWAKAVMPGETITVGGPGPAKPLKPGADWYLVLGDMTALPAIAVNLEAMPADAVGDAVIEIQSEADRQDIRHPEGVTLHWITNPEPRPSPGKIRKRRPRPALAPRPRLRLVCRGIRHHAPHAHLFARRTWPWP